MGKRIVRLSIAAVFFAIAAALLFVSCGKGTRQKSESDAIGSNDSSEYECKNGVCYPKRKHEHRLDK